MHGYQNGLVTCFNPRVREGRDQSRNQDRNTCCSVSIHASVKDATRLETEELRDLPGFNPRVREGRDNCQRH